MCAVGIHGNTSGADGNISDAVKRTQNRAHYADPTPCYFFYRDRCQEYSARCLPYSTEYLPSSSSSKRSGNVDEQECVFG
jgi:hypothetical protein